MLIEHEHSAAHYKTIYLEDKKRVFMCKRCPMECFDESELKVEIAKKIRFFGYLKTATN